MRYEFLVDGLAWLNMICWAVCFWWMHRISTRQNAFLAKLEEQGRRIENLSKVEHDLIKEVHPQVGEIKERVEKVLETTLEQSGNHPSREEP